MSARLILVQPIVSVDLDEPGDCCKPACASSVEAVGANAMANGQVLANLFAFLQQAMPMILQLIALFGKQTTPPAPANS
jgi:hypothetical protein